jgi:DNA polymerase-3 subunit delta
MLQTGQLVGTWAGLSRRFRRLRIGMARRIFPVVMAANPNIFAFFGTDEALVKEAATKLSGKIAPSDKEFGLEIISGGADNAEHAVQIISRTIEAIQTLPFFGGDKLVWLQGVNFFADNQTGKAESTIAAVEALVDILASHLPPDVRVIISAGDIDKRRSFYKTLSKCAKVEIFDKLDTSKAGWEVNVMGHVQDRLNTMTMVSLFGVFMMVELIL